MSIKIMTWVFEESPTTGAERLTLLALADNANDEGYCWPSLRTIAHKAGLDRRHTIRLLHALEAKGILVTQRRYCGRVYDTNMYRICWTESIREAERTKERYENAIAQWVVTSDHGGSGQETPGVVTSDHGGSGQETLGVVTSDHGGSGQETLGVVTSDHGGSGQMSLKPSFNHHINHQFNHQLTTTTNQSPEAENSSSGVVVVVENEWNQARQALSELGIIEGAIGRYIELARKQGWNDEQLMALCKSLAEKYGHERACSLLAYRIRNERPSLYGYTQCNPEPEPAIADWYLSDECLARLERAGMTEDELSELDDIARAQSWSPSEILAMLVRYNSPFEMLNDARNRPNMMRT